MYFNYPSVHIKVIKQNADFLITNIEACHVQRQPPQYTGYLLLGLHKLYKCPYA